MSMSGRHYSGPARTYTASRMTGDGASIFSGPPPSYSSWGGDRGCSEHEPTQRNCPDEERRPLLSRSPSTSDRSTTLPTTLLTLLVIVIIWPLAYFVYSLVFVPSQVALYKGLYDAARVQIVALMAEVDDLRGHLSKTKVEAFWEIARTMDVNMYVKHPVGTAACLRFCLGMSGWGRMIQVLGQSSGLTESRAANTTTTTLRLPPYTFISPLGRQPSSSRLTDAVWLGIGSNQTGGTTAGGWPRGCTSLEKPDRITSSLVPKLRLSRTPNTMLRYSMQSGGAETG
jgi:hypothetical protein